jgi:hypothetical protein
MVGLGILAFWGQSAVRLQPGSTPIRRGLPVTGPAPLTDIDCETRPNDTGVDILHDRS